ncbi:transcription-repair coupling factor, partial [bacterium]|nr:transcription-repair coupling factor [bacterium]
KYPVNREVVENINKDSIKIGKISNPEKDIYFQVFPVGQRFKIGEDFIWESYKDERLIIFSDNISQTQRLKEILQEKKINISQIEFHEGILSSGFSFPEINLTFLSNDEIFSRYRKRHVPFRKIESIPVTGWQEIKKGDYVVHYNEGIGKFVDMKKLKTDDKEEEFIVLEYEGGDKLYVPISQISFIHKYVGDKKPKLSKLGSKNWIKIKEKVKNSIRDLATDLYNLYIERKKEKGFKFSPDDELQKEFEESFIYQETEDQLKAIQEVKNDMMSEKIMDRIVCGDSGYGKTEVAMRASFKAVLSGKQVIVLVPTTVLALQHYLTFKERFADFPVIIEMLSRLVPEKKIKEILKNLKEGKIDIIIGTHRLLQDDVEIKNPGLLIIDEEQRFGVVHKEKIKAIFRRIDVLTLTATPIPRTLNMALSGLKDISLIETPPAGRLSVITYVGRYNEGIVKEAILREIDRGGQVFYLHNFIYDIQKVKEKLENLVPGIKIEVAHGRMKPEELQNVMENFSSGNIDVLVATTIVENGIDIPTANTLIVDNAHRYGLADLYQLRGRVGRYKWRAYAYFLIPPHIPVDKKTKERLKALQELNNPGSGYKIALRDLEIRGAGNILGKEQHGFIDMVGFHLYCQFWKEIMGEIKNEKVVYEPEEVKIEEVIPYDYIKTPSLRLWLYSKIAEIRSKKEANSLIQELKDRFGFIPLSLENYIKSTPIKKN